VLPAALRLAGSWRQARPLLLSAGLLLGLAFGLAAVSQTAAEARVQARDARLARILDYEQLRPFPCTAADSLGTAAISSWLLGDSAMVDPVLHGPVYRFDAADFAGRVVPAKLQLRGGLLLRDYFAVLLALLATAGAVLGVRRPVPRGFWLVQLGFAAGLVALAGILKLPPRLALPLLDCWLLTNLVFWLHRPYPGASPAVDEMATATIAANSFPASFPEGQGARHSSDLQQRDSGRLSWRSFPPLLRFGGTILVVVVAGLYAAKTWHRRQVLQREQHQHEIALAAIGRPAGAVRVLAGTNDVLKSLSPFRTYALGPGPVLQLTGWSSHDASQARLRQALSGTTDQTECLRRLANRAATGPAAPVVWMLTPEMAAWLSRRTSSDGIRLRLEAQKPLTNTGSDSAVWQYQATLQMKKM
jgi:hypothetical protein